MRKALQRTASGFDTSSWRSLVRLTFATKVGERFSAIAYGVSPRPTFSQDEIRELDGIEDAIRAVCLTLLPGLRRFGDKPGFPLDLGELVRIVEGTGHPMSVRDEKLRLLAANPPLEDLIGCHNRSLVGKGLRAVTGPYSEALELLYHHAFETGYITPCAEVTIRVPGTNSDASFEFHGSPVYLTDRAEPVVVIHYGKPGELRDVPERVSSGKSEVGALADFLFATLAKHRYIRSRNEVSYITLRSWSAAIRKHQINALSAIKGHEFSDFAERVGEEMHSEIDRFSGFRGFSAIVPVPGGHSQPHSSFSVALARSIARRAHLPFVDAFQHQSLSGRSHPKTNLSRPALVLNTRIERPVILVDDVATSGRHIEECVKSLKTACGSVLAVAWIGGNLVSSVR